MWTRVVYSLAVMFLLAGRVWSVEPEQGDQPAAASKLIGRAVLAKSPEIVLRDLPDEHAAVSVVSPVGIWLNVARVQGAWLSTEGGWIRASEVVRDDRAVEYFTTCLAQEENGFAYLCRSRAWLKENDLDKAQADVSEALRLDPRNARVFFAKARIAAALGRDDDEMTNYDQALRLDPRDFVGWTSRGDLWSRRGDYDRAIADFDRAAAIRPTDSHLLTSRGWCCSNKGELDRAFADFTAAIEIDPRNAFAYSRRAAIHAQRQEFERALADAEEAVRLNPKMAHGFAVRGGLRAIKGELDTALSDLDESIRLDASDPIAYSNRGRARFLKGDYDGAVSDYTQAVSLKADHADAYLGRAESWFKKGDHANAITNLGEYLRLRPKSAPAYSQRGWLRLDTNLDDALADFNAALRLDPRHAGALIGRATLWERKNKVEKAIEDLTAAIEANLQTPMPCVAERSSDGVPANMIWRSTT